jgi:hypothetical protein
LREKFAEEVKSEFFLRQNYRQFVQNGQGRERVKFWCYIAKHVLYFKMTIIRQFSRIFFRQLFFDGMPIRPVWRRVFRWRVLRRLDLEPGKICWPVKFRAFVLRLTFGYLSTVIRFSVSRYQSNQKIEALMSWFLNSIFNQGENY